MSTKGYGLGMFVAFGLWSAACKQVEREPLDSVIENTVGDPQKGYRFLVNANYIGCGIPFNLFERMRQASVVMPEAMKNYFAPTIEGELKLARPDLPGREGRNAELPYYLNAFNMESGVEVVNLNCLTCHAEKIGGKVVIGLGNVTRDFTKSMETVTRAGDLANFFQGEAEKKEWQRWARSTDGIAPYMIPETVGANPAVNITYALIAHLNKQTLTWQDKPLLEPPSTFVPPVDVPPWWRLKHRSTVFYNAEFQGDHRRYMMLASLSCIDGLEQAKAIEKMFYDIDAYITSLEAPKYPYKIDQLLATKGREIFQTECASCHGVYNGQELQYQESVVDWNVINTDPELWKMQAQQSDRFAQWVNTSWFGALGQGKAANGYVVPPLNGIWATAPFFHNGSVPTLEGVLDSKKRPAYWQRYDKISTYDEVAMGWPYKDLNNPVERALVDKRYVYDTSKKGFANTGHNYGDGLPAVERRALLEFLKTL